LPFLLGQVGVTQPLVLSGIISLVTVAALPGALLYGRFSQRLSATTIFAVSWALMGAGMLILSMALTVSGMAVGVVVVGFGLGPAMPGYTTYLMAVVPTTSRGRAAGLLTTAFFAGQFASPLISAPLVRELGLSGAFQALALSQLVLAAGLALASGRNGRWLKGQTTSKSK
jgi:MFS family permease